MQLPGRSHCLPGRSLISLYLSKHVVIAFHTRRVKELIFAANMENDIRRDICWRHSLSPTNPE